MKSNAVVFSEYRDHQFFYWPDEDLIEWLKKNERDSEEVFTVLIERHRSWIHRRCLFRLAAIQDAEDVCQDVILRVYGRLHQLQQPQHFRAWLRTIVDNSCISFSQRRALMIPFESPEQLMVEELTASDLADVLDRQRCIHRTLARLPATARQVLTLRFFRGYSLAEIADCLNLKLSAAKARLYRAMEQFRQLYDGVLAM